MTSTIAILWALLWLAVVVALTVLRERVGRLRAGAWLIVIGVALLVIEEPALTLWIGITGPDSDPDGMATRITPMAQAHVLDAAVASVAAAAALIVLAVRVFTKGRRWAWRALAWGFVVAFGAELATTLFVFSRGLPVPGAAGQAGRDGFGWQPVAVGLLAWAIGLAIGRIKVDDPDLAALDTARSEQ